MWLGCFLSGVSCKEVGAVVCKDLIFSNPVVKPNCQTLSASIRLHILVVPTWEAFYFQENSFVWFLYCSLVLLPTGREERGVLHGGWEYSCCNTTSCQDMKIYLHYKHEYSWVVKIRNTSEAVLRSQYSLGHQTDSIPMGLGQYNSLGEYCGPHTASSVFLI